MARKNENDKPKGFLTRLRRDEAGNVLMIMGASLIPMLAIIGGTVDISRGYMVKVRLQQACDAGALGGRQAVGEGSFDTDAAARAQALFNANFPAGYQGATSTTFTPNSTDGGITVRGVATTTMPTVVMGLFKTEPELKGLKTQSIQLTTECNAKMDVNNSDIMMVLDTTGSMACPNDSDLAGCATYWSSYGGLSIGSREGQGGTTSRMAALKTATKNFVSILNTAASGSNARIRFGMVPYTGTVNAGKLLYAANPEYVVGGNANENWNYQSRRPVYVITGPPDVKTTPETLVFNGATASVVREVFCTAFAGNQDTGGYGLYGSTWSTQWRYPADYGFSGSGQNVSKSGDPGATFTFSPNTWGPDNPSYNVTYTRKSCTRNVTRTAPTTTTTYDGSLPGATFSHYEYSQRALPVSAYVSSAAPSGSLVPDTFNRASESAGAQKWAGCILERETNASGSFAYNTSSGKITPAAALDLDIDSAPTNNASTRWKPYWPESSYWRNDATNGGKAQTNCPHDAQLLTKMTNAEFTTYVDKLTADGGTYHDIGMIWGTRLASPEGIFAANVNETPPNNGYVSRHMVVMTDGQLDAGFYYNNAYGIEAYDQQVSGGDSTVQSARHIARFKAVCEAAKAKKIRVWFVAFGTDLNADMVACASASSTFSASNASQLNDAFIQIAQSIAELRLTQ